MAEKEAQNLVAVVVQRSFAYEGQITVPGQVYRFSEPFAAMMIAAHKARPATPADEAAAPQKRAEKAKE
jgi:hypothetical protein